MFLLIDDYIVDGCLSSCTCCSWEGNDWYALLLGRSHTFEADDIAELRIVGHNADAFGRIHGGTTADSDDTVCLCLCESLDTILYIGDGWVRYYFIINIVSNACSIHDISHHLADTELHKALIGYDQCLLEAKTLYYGRKFFARTCTEITQFVKYETIHHFSNIFFRY